MWPSIITDGGLCFIGLMLNLYQVLVEMRSPKFGVFCQKRGLRSTRGRIRTLNLLIRSQVLYPVELRTQSTQKTLGEGYGKPIFGVWQVEFGFWLDFFCQRVNNIDPAWSSTLVDL